MDNSNCLLYLLLIGVLVCFVMNSNKRKVKTYVIEENKEVDEADKEYFSEKLIQDMQTTCNNQYQDIDKLTQTYMYPGLIYDKDTYKYNMVNKFTNNNDGRDVSGFGYNLTDLKKVQESNINEVPVTQDQVNKFLDNNLDSLNNYIVPNFHA